MRRASSSGSEQASTASAVYFREDASALGRVTAADPPEGEVHDRIRGVLGSGAEFWFDLLAAAGLEAEEALPALWDLVWAGEVTNDAWTPLRAGRRYGVPRPERRPRRFSRRRSTGITATQGRWSLTDKLFPGTPDRRALAELLLERQGIVTRDGVRAEGIPGGYSAVYGELKALETLGLSRRGYFVEGLGGAQFALGGAVERLRELRPKEGEEPEAFVIAAADPAQPYGAALPWPKPAGGRAARVAGAQVVLLGGEPALFVERGGRSIVSLREPDEEWLRPALAALVEHVKDKRGKRLAVERFDGEPVGETELMPLLLEAGFLAGPAPSRPAPLAVLSRRQIGTNPARCRHRFLGTLTAGGGWNSLPYPGGELRLGLSWPTPEELAEQGVPDRGLPERREAEQPYDTRLSASRVVAVDELPGREQGQVLEQAPARARADADLWTRDGQFRGRRARRSRRSARGSQTRGIASRGLV